jgi:hypothetical protein
VGVAVPVAGPLASGFLEPLDLLFWPKLRIGGPCEELSDLRCSEGWSCVVFKLIDIELLFGNYKLQQITDGDDADHFGAFEYVSRVWLASLFGSDGVIGRPDWAVGAVPIIPVLFSIVAPILFSAGSSIRAFDGSPRGGSRSGRL